MEKNLRFDDFKSIDRHLRIVNYFTGKLIFGFEFLNSWEKSWKQGKEVSYIQLYRHPWHGYYKVSKCIGLCTSVESRNKFKLNLNIVASRTRNLETVSGLNLKGRRIGQKLIVRSPEKIKIFVLQLWVSRQIWLQRPDQKNLFSFSVCFFGRFSATLANSGWQNLEFFSKNSLGLLERMEDIFQNSLILSLV